MKNDGGIGRICSESGIITFSERLEELKLLYSGHLKNLGNLEMSGNIQRSRKTWKSQGK